MMLQTHFRLKDNEDVPCLGFLELSCQLSFAAGVLHGRLPRCAHILLDYIRNVQEASAAAWLPHRRQPGP